MDRKFSRAVLRKMFVSSLSLSFSLLTTFHSVVNKARSECDNPRLSIRLDISHFPYLPCRRRFYLICIAISDRETQTSTICRQACAFARNRYRDRANNCSIDKKRFSNSWLLRIERNHVIDSLGSTVVLVFSPFLLFVQKFHPAKFDMSWINDKWRIWLVDNHFWSS